MNFILRWLSRYRRYLMEAMGTMYLVLTVALNISLKTQEGAGLLDPVSIPLAVGSILMVMIYAGGHVSGAHYNPAVTLGIYLRGGDIISFTDTVLYIISQNIGALIGSLLSYAVTSVTFAPHPQPGFGLFTTFGVELLYSVALVFVVITTSTTKALAGNNYFGLAIGFTVTAGAFTTAGVSGAAFNPALATASMIVDTASGAPYYIQYIWIYWIAALIGSCIAATLYRIINPGEYEEIVEV